MRILSLRFKNLNSLVGEWSIDFTHPEYESHGIFAITGPTGAGKSTLLDAMGLALYGQTPRLGRITKSDNEIMSRRTGDCFAELQFETAKGQFQVHWSQHRARRTAQGELQQPKHELTDLTSGAVLETLLNRVIKRVEELTGMDFERFTRSMLLAQGSFAAFLQAKADERAPILEQITGTDIYSRISVLTHERFSAERKQLQQLQEQIAHLALLDSSTEAALIQEIEQYQSHSRQQQVALTEKNTRRQQALQLQQRQKDHALLLEKKAELAEQQHRFAPKAEQLVYAEAAQKLAAGYAQLTAHREQCARATQSLTTAHQQQPVLEQQRQQHVVTLQSEQQRYQQLKDLLDVNRPLYEQVRALDTQLQQQKTVYEQHVTTWHTAQSQTQRTQQQTTQTQAQISVQQEILQQVTSYLSKQAADAGLNQDLLLLNAHHEHIEQVQHQLQGLAVESAAAAADSEQASQDLPSLQQQLAGHQARASELNLQLMHEAQERQALLQDQTPQYWYEQHLLLTQKEAQYLQAHQLHERLRQLQTQQQEQLAVHEQLETTQNQQQILQQHMAQQASVLEQTVQQLQHSLELEQRINALESERQRLVTGEPCVLCGALEHPYAGTTLTGQLNTRQELAQSQADLKQAYQQLAQVDQKIADLKRDLTLSAHQQQRFTTDSQSIHDQWQPLYQALGELLPTTTTDKEQFLQDVWQHIETALKHCAWVRASLEKTDEKTKQINLRLQQSTQQQREIEQRLQGLEQQKQQALLILKNLQKAQHKASQQQADLCATFNELLQPYGLQLDAQTTWSTIFTTLTQRQTAWNEAAQAQQQTQQLAKELEQRLAFELQQLAAEQHNEQQTAALVQKTQQAWQSTQQNRESLFGTLDPNIEQKKATEQLEHAETTLATASSNHQQTVMAVEQLAERILWLTDQLNTQQQALLQSETSFKAALPQWHFSDEAHYLAMRLDEVSFQQLRQEQQTLQQKQLALQTEMATNLKDQEALAVFALNPEALDSLVLAIDALQQNMAEQQQQIGRLNEQLQRNEANKTQQQQQLLLIEQQQIELNKWSHLHALIGSADGKKFRNFAQGLTFEIMVHHANQQLQKMSDRYMLLRDTLQPLELLVMDNYQAGEVRSTKNLSGGEGFIVSLALALGLSQMASQNVRIDSLFLDEGFGTLDEDALDTAITTLSSLQQEGKLIGLISHVSTLKERISTQIQVNPTTGGRSVLTGPGCLAVAK